MAERIRAFRSSIENIKQMILMAWHASPQTFTALAFTQILQGIFPVVTAWLFRSVIDVLALSLQSKATTDFMSSFLPLLIIYVSILALNRIMNLAQDYLRGEMTRQTQLYTETLFNREINRLQGIRHFESPEFHDTMRLAQQSLSGGPTMMLWTLTGMVQQAVSIVSFFGVLLVLSPLLALLILLVAIPYLAVQFRVSNRRYLRTRWETPKGRKSHYLGNLLSNTYFVKEVRLFNLQDYLLNQFLETTREIFQSQREQARTEFRWQFTLELFNSIISGIAFVYVIQQAFLNIISLGDVTLYISALQTVQGSLFGLIRNLSELNEQSLYYASFVKLTELPNDIPIPENPRPVPLLKQGIELKNVSFRYTENGEEVLCNINLSLPVGKTLALVGLNGAGKTTLVKLLSRLYDPDEGQVLWDGIDLREFSPIDLRERMGAIFQDFAHYDLTVRENIGLGNVKYIDDFERIQQVARDARVHEMIEEMPHAYETILSRWIVEKEEDGKDLSGGQWQKIALARMYMREADFLILDEPTASLDAEAEYEIYSHFAKLLENRTALLISHRFSTVRMADLIAVLEDGKITEYGTHEELMRNASSYAKLYRMQSERYT